MKNDNVDKNYNREDNKGKQEKEDGERVTAHVQGGEAQRLTGETVTVVGPGNFLVILDQDQLSPWL